MSFLDMDERLLKLAELIDIVYSPIVDAKVFPENVDLTIVEGAVSNEDDLHKIKLVRSRTKLLMALGDCAVTSNVPGMRNQVGREAACKRAYFELATAQPQIPGLVISSLVKTVQPIHTEIKVDVFVPGCPPSAERIYFVLAELLAGRMPKLEGDQVTFG